MSIVELKQGSLRERTHDHGPTRVARIRRLIAVKNSALLTHRYFQLCRNRELSRAQMLELVKQLYCFSVFFERLLTQRIAEFSSDMDQRVVRIAREHLREEIGHAELFYQCLAQNGLSPEELSRLTPKMFTKALSGYLLSTIQHENEYVSNIAIMQVMESIGYHFFTETLPMMHAHSLSADALVQHSEDDEHHPELGLELVADFNDKTLDDCHRVVEDVYRLMGFVLDEWLGLEPTSPSLQRKRRTSRPPRAN